MRGCVILASSRRAAAGAVQRHHRRAGVRVGYATLIRDTPRVVRTGVTAIWPRGQEIWTDDVFAGIHSFNGNGEMTGLPWIAEQG